MKLCHAQCARTAQQPRMFWLLNDTQPLVGVCVDVFFWLPGMAATAAACTADERNLLQAGGGWFPRTFFTPLAVCFVCNGCLNGGSYCLLFQGVKTPIYAYVAGAHKPPFPRGLSQRGSSNTRTAQCNSNGDEC